MVFLELPNPVESLWMDTCICMAESLHCSETVTVLLVNWLYTPLQNKLKKKVSGELYILTPGTRSGGDPCKTCFF